MKTRILRNVSIPLIKVLLGKLLQVFVIFVLLLQQYIIFNGDFASNNTAIYTFKNLSSYQVLTDNERYQNQTDWQNVGYNYDKTFSIYSAYAMLEKEGDSETNSTGVEVQIIASYSRFPANESLQCRFFYKSSNNSIKNKTTASTPAVMKLINGWDYVKHLTGNVVRCQLVILPVGPNVYPEFVTILVGNQTESSARVRIQYLAKTDPRKMDSEKIKYDYTFSLCMKPMHGGGPRDLINFLEWYEFYKMMGVKQFTFYKMVIGNELNCLLDHLQHFDKEAKVNVLPWKSYPISRMKPLPGSFDGMGKSEVFQDCVWRHRGARSKYVINVDYDEFIMPREANNYFELMEILNAKYRNESKKAIGDFVFQNGFFVKDRPKSTKLEEHCAQLENVGGMEFQVCKRLWMMQYVRRDPYTNFPWRTKNIFRPDASKVLLNHYVVTFEPGYQGVRIDPNIAFSRHYRHFGRAKKYKIDGVPEKLGVSLATKVVNILKNVMEKCEIKENKLFI